MAPKWKARRYSSGGGFTGKGPAQNATHTTTVADHLLQELHRRRDDWLNRVHHATDHHLGYQTDGGAVGLLQQPKVGGWSLFTCLNALRDVEDSIPLLLDTNDYNLRAPAGAGPVAANPGTTP